MLTIRKLARTFRRQYSLIVGALSLVIVLMGAIAAFTAYLKATQIDNSARAARSLATMLADETDRSIQSVSLIIARVAARLETAGVDTPSSLDQAAGAVEFRAFLNDRIAEDASLDTIYVVSAKEPAFAREASSRTIMAIHAWDQVRALEEAGPDGIYLSSPFRSRTTGAWQLSLTKRVSAKDGEFLGVVSGVINLSSFSDLLGKLALGEHASLSVIRDDGEIIACFPTRELSLGSELAATPLFRNFIAVKRNGVTRQESDVDRLERMFAVVNSDKFPVASVVAVAMNDVLAGWRFQAQVLELGAALIAAVILIGAILLALRVEQLAEAREREALQAQSAIQYARFNNAMDNIVQGLAMYSRNGALIVCNRRYAEIYGLPLELANQRAKPGGLPIASETSRFGKPIDKPSKERDGSVLVLSKLPDGRLIAQRKKALADGGWVSTHEDVTAHHEAEEKIKIMATRDALTGLLNRFGFKQRLEQCLAEAQRRTGRFALLYLDLDRFKRVNDTLGHPVGDRLLQAVAARMTGEVRKSDATARLGGDEFAVIQRVAVAPRDAARLAERLVAAMAEPYEIDGVRIEIGASIGIAFAPDDSIDADEILRLADLALYHSKADRGSYHFFQTEMDQEFRSKRQLEDDLKSALSEGQFEVHFQPIVSLADGHVTAFEALLRWKHPVRGSVPPSDFIPVAEETGVIVSIGAWVMRVACREATRWPGSIAVAVNVSAIQFGTPAFSQTVFEALETAGLPASRLIVELTESVMMKDSDAAIATLQTIRAEGVRTSMDDFGTGYSSLSYMRRLPFDKIKIDKAFITEIGVRDDSTAIVRAAVALAGALGMQTVAEGIETDEQLTRARIEGVTEAQGYLTGRPMSARQALVFLGVEPVEDEGPEAKEDARMAAARIADAQAATNVTAFKPRKTGAPAPAGRAEAPAARLRPASR